MAVSDISLEPLWNRRLGLLVIEGYQTSNWESDPGGTSYYGFEDKDGRWYIIEETVSGKETTHKFERGDSGYAAAWTGRKTGSYDTFSATF